MNWQQPIERGIAPVVDGDDSFQEMVDKMVMMTDEQYESFQQAVEYNHEVLERIDTAMNEADKYRGCQSH